MEFDIGFISGFNIGLEFPPPYDENVKWNFILDLLIVRIVGSRMLD